MLQDQTLRPDDVEFHDAVILAIEQQGNDRILLVEYAYVSSLARTVECNVKLLGIGPVQCSDEGSVELKMLGDDAEILDFDVDSRGQCNLLVIWDNYENRDEKTGHYEQITRRYLFSCQKMEIVFLRYSE